MFWFKHLLIVFFHMFHSISIHHMFWFKPYSSNYFQNFCYFNTSYVLVQENFLFQLPHLYLYFNTSYVLVQGQKTWVCKTEVYISIHHMFWFKINFSSALLRTLNFNTSYVLVQDFTTACIASLPYAFQYIICFGSRFVLFVAKEI